MFNPPRRGGAAGLDEADWIGSAESDLARAPSARGLGSRGRADRPFFLVLFPYPRHAFREPFAPLPRPNREPPPSERARLSTAVL